MWEWKKIYVVCILIPWSRTFFSRKHLWPRRMDRKNPSRNKDVVIHVTVIWLSGSGNHLFHLQAQFNPSKPFLIIVFEYNRQYVTLGQFFSWFEFSFFLPDCLPLQRKEISLPYYEPLLGGRDGFMTFLKALAPSKNSVNRVHFLQHIHNHILLFSCMYSLNEAILWAR